MFGRKLMTVGFGLALVSGVGCSRPLCDVNPDDDRCPAIGDGGSINGPTFTQKRLHYKTGGQLDFTGLDTNASIVLEQNGISTTIGKPPLAVNNGALSITATPSTGFKPGRAKVVINLNSKSTEYPIWLYANPNFNKSAKFTLLTIDGKPNWAGVNNKILYTLHTYASTQRHLITYSYDDSNSILIRSATQPWDVALPSYAKAALTKQGMLQLRQHTATSEEVFVGCLLENQSCISANQVTVPAKTTYNDTDFIADYNEAFYAFIDGANNLNVWSIASRLPNNTPVALDTSLDNSIPINQLATGDFDGDAKGDLLIWQSLSATNGTATLYLGQQNGTLKYDSFRSMQIQQQIGTGPLTSLSIGDLDADGLADVTYSSSGTVQIIINQVNGFKKITPSPLATTAVSPDIVSVGDIGGTDLEGLSVNDITFVAKKSPGECVIYINAPN